MTVFTIGFVLFPDVTQLDLTGPLQVLHRLPGSKVDIVAKTRDPVPTDCGLGLLPTADFVGCGPLDLICVPGGRGVLGAVADAETMDFVRRQGARAKWVTSVCTGAFVLGAAGLLKGRRATTHWAYTGLLPLVGATHEEGRVVRDGNIFTGGGVTAGIDFALAIAAEIAGPDRAESIRVAIEYDPPAPVAAGHPDRALAAIRERLAPRYEEIVARYRAAFGADIGRVIGDKDLPARAPC